MTTVTIPRVFGGTLLITLAPPVAPRVLKISYVGVADHINATFSTPRPHMNATFSTPRPHMNATFSEVAMTTPNTTIDSSATVKDQNGNLITSLSASTLTVTFPDFSTASPSVVNVGSGVYTATYATKGPGIITELWSFTDVSGAVAQDTRLLTIAY